MTPRLSESSTRWSCESDPDGGTHLRLYGRQDMRRSFDALALALAVKENLALDPESGLPVVFASKRGKRLKVLWFDHNGYCLLYSARTRCAASFGPSVARSAGFVRARRLRVEASASVFARESRVTYACHQAQRRKASAEGFVLFLGTI
jgi:hypothetical protein